MPAGLTACWADWCASRLQESFRHTARLTAAPSLATFLDGLQVSPPSSWGPPPREAALSLVCLLRGGRGSWLHGMPVACLL
jgi:hypothetical protein